MNIFVTVY